MKQDNNRIGEFDNNNNTPVCEDLNLAHINSIYFKKYTYFYRLEIIGEWETNELYQSGLKFSSLM